MFVNDTIIQGLKEMVFNHKAGIIKRILTCSSVCLIKSFIYQDAW